MVEVLKGLTPRLADSQSNLKPLAASAIAELASSLGTDAGTKVPTYVRLLLRNHPIGNCFIEELHLNNAVSYSRYGLPP